MTKFEQTIKDALSMVDYEYGQYTADCYEITAENLKHLVENVCLAVIYDQEIQKEIYTETN